MISRRVQALRVILTFAAWATTGWPGALLLFAAETWSGRIAGALALFVPGWLLSAMAFKPMRSTASVAGFLVLFTVSSTTLVLRAPNMEGVAGSGIRSVHASGERPAWWAPTRLVPEIDQLLFGSYLAPLGDPLIDRHEAGVLRDAIRSVYRPLLKDPRFAELGSVLGDGLLNRATGHFFEYVPAHAPGERLPMVLLLHGSLGNWTGYLAETVRSRDRRRSQLRLLEPGRRSRHHSARVLDCRAYAPSRSQSHRARGDLSTGFSPQFADRLPGGRASPADELRDGTNGVHVADGDSAGQ